MRLILQQNMHNRQDKTMAALSVSLLLMFSLLATVSGQSSIVSTNTITSGGKFTVTCDHSRVNPPQNVYSVASLAIYRNLTATNSYSLIAKYSSRPPPSLSGNVTNIPAGRNWTIVMNGGNDGANNLQSMKIVWDINDVSCADAGIYRCVIEYFLASGSTSTPVQSPDQNVTTTTGLSRFDLTVSPTSDNNEYNVDDNITFTCSALGPATGLNFKWELWAKDQFDMERSQPLPYNSEIVNKPPTLQGGNTGAGCTQYNWVSTLGIQVPVDYEQQSYKCIVTYMQQEESGNVTIDLTRGSVQPSIVSTNIVAPEGKFSVYCDTSRVKTPKNLISVGGTLNIYRRLTTTSSYSRITQYYKEPDFGSSGNITNIPPGRNWTYTVSRDNGGSSNNIDTMKMVLDVNDVSCSDSGTYRCVVEYYTNNRYNTITVQARDQIVTVTRGHPSIVSINSINERGTFSVYCDASRADTPQTGVRSIQALSIYRSGDLIAHYNSVNPRLFNDNVKNVPYGKNWNITFSGDNHGSNNIATMKIVIDVYNVASNDVGVFRCQIGYYLTHGGLTSVLAPDQEVTALPRGQSSIVSTNSITSGGKFTVYCDESRASRPWFVYSIQALSIYRMGETDSSYSLIAHYNSVNPDFSADVKNIPPGRNWTITFRGDNEGSYNFNTMKIVWDINDVMFTDHGMYRCQIGYYSNSGGFKFTQAPDQYVTFSGSCS